MSLPARSDMRNGPMANPNFSMARSTCCGEAPSSSISSACCEYGLIMRLPMKPSQTPDTTAVLPMRRASDMRGGEHVGPGLLRAHHFQQPHDVRGTEEMQAEHVAGTLGERGDARRRRASRYWWRESRRASRTASSSRNTAFLTSRSSNTASMTRSALRGRRVVERRRDRARRASRRRRASACPWPPRLRSTCGCRRCRDPALPASPRASVTGMPAFAKLMAMPPPMVPAPTTATRAILRCGVLSVEPGDLRRPRVRRRTHAAAPAIPRSP